MASYKNQSGTSPEDEGGPELERNLTEGETALSQNAERIDFLLSQFFDAYFALDPQWRMADLRGNISGLFQRAPQDLQGKVIWDEFPTMVGGELYQKAQAAWEGDKPVLLNGALIPGRGWLEVTINPTREKLEFFIRDISNYRQMQATATGDEKGRIIFDSLLEYIPEGIIIADAADFSFLVVSKYGYEILGLHREDLLHHNLSDLLQRVDFFLPDGQTRIDYDHHQLTRSIKEGYRTEDDEAILRNALGKTYNISIKGGPILNQDGQIIAGIFSWMDVSERKKNRDLLEDYASRLEQSNQELENFAHTVSHNLQEPLRKVQGFSEILLRNHAQKLDAEGLETLERIKNAGYRMQRMIKDLLIYSQVTTSRIQHEAVDLNEVLPDVLSDFQILLEKTGGHVDVSQLPVVYANRNKMQQLFQNLVGNALKFHRLNVPPQVRVYAAPSEPEGGKWARIAVEDNGIGFKTEYLDWLFKPFQRLNTPGADDGSGIGLSICSKIVDRYGGNITAESTPGQGSTFWVTLPAEPPDEEVV